MPDAERVDVRPTSHSGHGYLLCASPRTGSTLLCDLLTQTGVAGAPQSYVRPASAAGFRRDWGLAASEATLDDDYLREMRIRGRGGSSRFAMRVMWSDLPPFVAFLRSRRTEPSPPATLLQEELGVDRFIHLTRTDRLAQAVSLVIAEQTGLWHRHADGSERQRTRGESGHRYNRRHIEEALDLVDGEATAWQHWFDEQGISPLSVSYESLSADPTGTLTRVLQHIGVETRHAVAVTTARTSGEINDEWIERFRSGPRSW